LSSKRAAGSRFWVEQLEQATRIHTKVGLAHRAVNWHKSCSSGGMDLNASRAEQVLGIHPRALDLILLIRDSLVRATLNAPLGARGVVAVFAPPGSSRFDAPSRFFAQVLEQAGLATLSRDSLESPRGDEAEQVVSWLASESFTAGLPIGLLAFEPSVSLDVAGVRAQLLSTETNARAAERAAELFVQRLT
jgi:hypothetical protein